MAQHSYTARIAWEDDGAFPSGRYSRAHEISFDGGARLRGSSSPYVVPLPFSDPAGVDPEEALIASVAACHMLWFLSLAQEKGLHVAAYVDAGRLRGSQTRRPRYGRGWDFPTEPAARSPSGRGRCEGRQAGFAPGPKSKAERRPPGPLPGQGSGPAPGRGGGRRTSPAPIFPFAPFFNSPPFPFGRDPPPFTAPPPCSSERHRRRVR